MPGRAALRQVACASTPSSTSYSVGLDLTASDYTALALGIRNAQAGGTVSSEDAILGCVVFILEQEFLIDQPGDVCRNPSPFVFWHEERPSPAALAPPPRTGGVSITVIQLNWHPVQTGSLLLIQRHLDRVSRQCEMTLHRRIAVSF